MSTFIWVLLTVVIAFGIFLYSFLYSAEKLSWMIIFKLLFRPYLLVFGELGISTYSSMYMPNALFMFDICLYTYVITYIVKILLSNFFHDLYFIGSLPCSLNAS